MATSPDVTAARWYAPPVRLAFVTPRYGAGVVGGAEAQAREAAVGLAARGHDVEVLTTVALDAHTWAPALPPGTTHEDGVTVRRFELTPGAPAHRRDALDHRVLSGVPLDAAEELAWVDARFAVPGLARHLTEERGAPGGAYDAVVYTPYLFWTTLRCLPLTRSRSILVPCLHDEPLARLAVVRATLAAAAEVWFLSEPEHRLAHRIAPLGPHRVVGSAVHEPSGAGGAPDAEAFRRRHGLSRPFALYAGRREDGKGWPQALAGFTAAVRRHGLDLDLVTFGSGDAARSGAMAGESAGAMAGESAGGMAGTSAGRVVDLGFLDASEVPGAFAAASVFLQPSPNESFSRTVMEAWLAGVPVVATAAGEVVVWHCERSGGGLLYGDDIELGECIRALVDDPAAAAAMGEAGRRYVRANCTWPGVLDRMEASLATFDPAAERTDDRPPAERLGATARSRAVEERRKVLVPDPRFPLAPWLPAPGAGTPLAAAAGAGTGGPEARPRPGVVDRALGLVERGARRWAPATRAFRAARAARSAWASERPVAQPRDVR